LPLAAAGPLVITGLAVIVIHHLPMNINWSSLIRRHAFSHIINTINEYHFTPSLGQSLRHHHFTTPR